MDLAQKDQLLEIGSGAAVRLTHHMARIERPRRQTIVSNGVRTNLLFTMSYRTGGELEARRKPGSLRVITASSQHRMVEPDGIEPTTSCLQSTRSPS